MNEPKYISYAHQDAPEGSRFLDLEGCAPAWAVDIRPETKKLNWMGLPDHPTDEFLHWTARNENKEVETLRQTYDELVSLVGEEKVKLLMDTAYSAGRIDEHDANNPDM